MSKEKKILTCPICGDRVEFYGPIIKDANGKPFQHSRCTCSDALNKQWRKLTNPGGSDENA